MRATTEQVAIRQVKHGRQTSLGKCGKVHATGSGPSGLGMMQPEERPQQSRLMMQKDTCRRDRPVRPGNNAARGALPAK